METDPANSELVSTSSEDYPYLGDRLQATMIDAMLIIVMMFVFAAILDKLDPVPTWVRIGLFIVLFGVYEPVSTASGSTLGNYIKGIRVRQYNDSSKRLNLLQAYIRYFFKFAFGWISFLTIHSNPKRRAIHDLVAGSVMIRK